MASMDLKKLNRKQLLELLLKQTARTEELEKQLLEKEQRLYEIEQKIKDIDLMQQIKGMFEDMERKCTAREAEAERKIIAANSMIVKANEKIAQAEKLLLAGRDVSETKNPVSGNDVSGESNCAKEKKQGNDILQDFFVGVIGK